MKHSLSHRATIKACYLGNIVQAASINLTPILYVPLREQFGLSYTQFGTLVLVNFVTQVLCDIAFSKPVDKYGFRPFVVTGHFLCVAGFALFALTPVLFPQNIFLGFLLSTVVFSGSGGLLELLLSPIVDAVPSDAKEKAMSLLHSFYAWGQIAVVLITTLFLFAFGSSSWPVIVLLWALLPLFNAFYFLCVPLDKKLSEDKVMKIRRLIRNPIFILAFVATILGGASEAVMAQWSSAFLENGAGLPKVLGDTLGMCGFALMLGIGRLIYGIYGDRLNIHKIMISGSLLTVFCYLAVALSPWGWLSIAACSLCGIGISLLWPGTLVASSKCLPLAGASMFALLAAGGDIGSSLGPWFTGVMTDAASTFIPAKALETLGLTAEQFGLRFGIFCAAVIPLSCFLLQLLYYRSAKKRMKSGGVPVLPSI